MSTPLIFGIEGDDTGIQRTFNSVARGADRTASRVEGRFGVLSRNMDRHNASMAQGFNRFRGGATAAIGVIAAVGQAASRSLEEAGEHSSVAAQQALELKRAFSGVNDVLARGWGMAVPLFERARDAMEGIQLAAVAMGPFGGFSFDPSRAQEMAEAWRLDRETSAASRRLRPTLEANRAMELQEAIARGDEVEATRLREEAATRQYRDSLDQQLREGLIDQGTHSRLMERREGIEGSLVAQARERVREQALDAEAARVEEYLSGIDANRDYEERMSSGREAFFTREQEAELMLQIDERRAQGLEREAELLRINLDTQREIRDLAADEFLDRSEKEAALERINEREQRRIDLLNTAADQTADRPDPVRSVGSVLEAGLASNAAVRAVVFGGGGDGLAQTSRRSEGHLLAIASTLGRMEQRGGAAVFS